MDQVERAARRAKAAADFNAHHHRSDGARLANQLADGLSQLRDLFYARIHQDVVRVFGVDTLLSPLSASKSELRTKTEIDVYLAVEGAAWIRERRYLPCDDDWCLTWLMRLRLGDAVGSTGVAQRMAFYMAGGENDRRLAFAGVIERVLPEASRAPLVAYRLLPLSVGIAVAIAFGDHDGARNVRKQQMVVLPSIGDCHACHGRVVENGEKCATCGNPFWNYDWLTSE